MTSIAEMEIETKEFEEMAEFFDTRFQLLPHYKATKETRGQISRKQSVEEEKPPGQQKLECPIDNTDIQGPQTQEVEIVASSEHWIRLWMDRARWDLSWMGRLHCSSG